MPFDLTGLWKADDGGSYAVRQIDSTVWWVGMSKRQASHPELDSADGEFYPGLDFCNVYRGEMIEQLVYGQWSDVPRGATANHGDMTLLYIDGNLDEQQLVKDSASGGFGASSWRRVQTAPIPRSAAALFRAVHKNVQVFLGNQETLADNLQLIRDSASVFGVVKSWSDHTQQPVSVAYSEARGLDYQSFICGGDGDGDGDTTFFILADQDHIQQRQPAFYADVDPKVRADAETKMAEPIEGEIIMYGRAPDCDNAAADSPPLFPGWAEQPGSSVLFNGTPIPVVLLPPGVGSNQPNFLSELHFEDPVRVTGALVFDIGHPQHGLEIHPVYSVESIVAAASNDLSGTWADDFGNTYYVRHYPGDNTMWYAGLSPLGSDAFGQVFNGSYDPAASTVTGNIAALSFGFEASSPPLGFSPTPLGDTGRAVFQVSSTSLEGQDVTMMSVGNFRLMRLHDFPQNVGQI